MRFAPVILAAFLAVDPWGFDRFGPLRFALVSAFGFAAIWSVLVAGIRTPVPRWARLGGALLAVGLVTSAAFADDPWHALVGTPDRHFGLVTWLLCAGLFVAAFRRTAQDRDGTTSAVLRAVTVATLGVGLYSIAEILELGSLDQDFANDRIGGPWGQPAFLGAAMTIGVPLSAAHARVEAGLARVLATVAASVGAIAVLSSQSRAAWVGLAVAATLAAALRWRSIHDRLGPNRSGLGAGVLVGVFVMVAVLTPAGARAWSLTDIDDGVVAGRVDEWQVGVRALINSGTGGLLGLGPENYRTVFGEHVDADYVVAHGRDTFTDRAHNSLLDVALAGGLLAAMGHLAIMGGVIRGAIGALRSGSSVDGAFGVALVASVVQSLFLFPLAEVDPVVAVVAGVFIARTSAGPTTSTEARSAIPAVLGGFALAAAIAAAAVGTLDVLADRRIAAAAGTESAAVALDHADAARRLRPDSIRYHFAAARIAASEPNGAGVPGAFARLDDGLAWSPVDPALQHERTLVLINEARRTVAPEAVTAALGPLVELDRIDPNHPEGQQRLGIALALDGQTDAAIAEFEHAAALAPDQPEALINLAIVHIDAGNTDAAIVATRRAQRVAPDDDRVRRLAAQLNLPAPSSS